MLQRMLGWRFGLGVLMERKVPCWHLSKLRSKKIDLCKILHKFGENAYEVALPQGL